MRRTLAMFLFLATGAAVAGEPAFDVHVHLREGETSLRAYQADVKVAGLELQGLGAMWFGGPHQALQGELDKVRVGNDSVIALAAKYPQVMPIATVHPYDGSAALAELARVAAAGRTVHALERLDLTAEEKAKIRSGNARRLFGR